MNKLFDAENITLTPKQQFICDKAIDWYHNSSEQIFQFAGNPGTGKTVTLKGIIKRLNLSPFQVAFMSYVGNAAINMRINGLSGAKTIHSTIYDTIEEVVIDEYGNPVMNKYFNRPETQHRRIRKKLDDIDLFVIDEAGTVPLRMRNDIVGYGKKILCCGDLDQMPPVGDNPAFLTSGHVYVLDEILRQNKNSAVIYLCQRAKLGLPIHVGVYGNEVIVMEEKDFKYIQGMMLPLANTILCGKNETRDKYTNILRYEILKKQDILPDFGEKLMCRINDWNIESGGINLTNGLIGRVMNQPDVSSFDGKCFRINFMPDSADAPFFDIPVDYTFFTADHETRRQMKNFNYCVGEAMEYGYCQTVNTAQGSQWNTGIYFEEWLPSHNNERNYTALSRFRKQCIYVKKDRKYW